MAQAGDIALFPFPQTNLVAGKLRPALLIKPLPSYPDDWLVCMISSQLHQYVSGLDEIVSPTDADFVSSGLASESCIRVSRLAIVSHSIFLGKMGEISAQRLEHIKLSLISWIQS